MFRSLFHDQPQGSSFVLSAPTNYQPPVSSFVFFGFVAVYPLFVCVSSVPVCVLSGRFTTRQHTAFFIQLRHCRLKVYCAILVRRSNFRHQSSPHVSPRKSTQRRKVELWARNVREFCLNIDLDVTFRDLLHTVKLGYGTDGFTSPPKEGGLRIFSS
jgi:hypothetical protein